MRLLNDSQRSMSDIPPPLAEAVRRLVEAYQPLEIWLFGSQARGDAGPDSDYDLMLIVPDDAETERLDGARAYPILWGVGTAIDIVIWEKSGFERRAVNVIASLPATVKREGRLLYAA